MSKKIFLFVLVSILVSLTYPTSPIKAAPEIPSLSWLTCTTCVNPPEVSIVANTINMGVPNRLESEKQPASFHGAATILPPAKQYTITFRYDLYTWDSYYNPIEAGKGYWDSFSFSISSLPLWQMSLSDPITPDKLPGLGFIWGGTKWGDHILKHVVGTQTVQLQGTSSGNNYLNVFLETFSTPHSDNNYPSWGSITINNIEIDPNLNLGPIRSQAAEIAKTVVGGKYLWGGKGWNMANPYAYVSSQKIVTDGYSYWNPDKFNPITNKKGIIDFGKGLDCSGLVYWSYNLAAGTTKFPGYPITLEGAAEQRNNNTTSITESELMPGDLLFFSSSATDATITHVAMYVGGTDPGKNVVEAANSTDGIIYSSLNLRKSATNFRSYGRVNTFLPKMVIKTHSPITLTVIDPDGFSVSSDTFVNTGEEYIRGIPGVLYYTTNEFGDDIIYAPILKTGTYTIIVTPKPEAKPGDTYGLEIFGAAKLVDLAQNTPINQIPTGGYRITSFGAEINPSAPFKILFPLIKKSPALVTNIYDPSSSENVNPLQTRNSEPTR